MHNKNILKTHGKQTVSFYYDKLNWGVLYQLSRVLAATVMSTLDRLADFGDKHCYKRPNKGYQSNRYKAYKSNYKYDRKIQNGHNRHSHKSRKEENVLGLNYFITRSVTFVALTY